MTEQTSPLATFYKPGWENYHHALVQTIAALSSEQEVSISSPAFCTLRIGYADPDVITFREKRNALATSSVSLVY